MALVAVIADTHWGARNDHPVLRDRMVAFHRDVFFPACAARGVTQVVHLGDLFDRRKYVNYLTASACRSSFSESLVSSGMSAFVLVGNHDSYYRNTLKQNSVRTMLNDSPRVTVVDSPAVVELGSTEVCLFPWVCDDNEDASVELMRTGPPWAALGHFELAGFEMHRGVVSSHGMEAANLGRFDAVLSGHFHTPSTRGNIRYVGAAGQYTWADHADARGFHFMCTETGRLEFVPNPLECFAVVSGPLTEDLSEYAGMFLKVSASADVGDIATTLEAAGAADVQIVETAPTESEREDAVAVGEIDTLELVVQHVVKECADPAAERLARELYAEAEAAL